MEWKAVATMTTRQEKRSRDQEEERDVHEQREVMESAV
jgi:hypothetical protein